VEIVVEEISDDTKSVTNDWLICVRDIDHLNEILGFKPNKIYTPVFAEISKKNVQKLLSFYGLDIEVRGKRGSIREKNAMDDLPYKVHTNRELRLMLEGSKPLSFFYSRDLTGADGQFNNQPFQRYVRRKIISEFRNIVYDKDEEGNCKNTGVLYVTYTLPGEEWRAKALILLKETHSYCRWNEGMERMEGVLLGYTKEQIDYYIKNFYKPS